MWWLLWCFCLLAESYETINHYHYLFRMVCNEWPVTEVAGVTFSDSDTYSTWACIYWLLNDTSSDVVETVTFETETETWLKFRDKTETLSKTPRPRLETWSSRPRPKLETWKFVHFAEIFQKNVVTTFEYGRPQWGETGISHPWD